MPYRSGINSRKWAEQGYTGKGHNPAEGLINELAGARKHSKARPFVHIMQDDDIEEDYHAQFMQQALHQAGFASKILRGLGELRWDDAGQLIDGDGRLVNCVWKPGVGNGDGADTRSQRDGVCRSAYSYRAPGK